VNRNHFSLILLPTLRCNADCTYCFENKTADHLTLEQLSVVVTKVLDFMEEREIAALTIHWQGGEVMTLPPAWFERAHAMIQSAAAARGKRVSHGLQTNMIGYKSGWNRVLAEMFGNRVGTSMDYPNLYRILHRGGPEEYTRLWARKAREAMEAGIDLGVIAVLSDASLEVGAERFYSYFVDEVGVNSFQVNTPFAGGDLNAGRTEYPLDDGRLSRFLVDLVDVWMERGYDQGVGVGPFDELIRYFLDGSGTLPCIWQKNCADEFITIDPRGHISLCDCWVASYPEYRFGSIFEERSLAEILRDSPARREFLDRPAALVQAGGDGSRQTVVGSNGSSRHSRPPVSGSVGLIPLEALLGRETPGARLQTPDGGSTGDWRPASDASTDCLECRYLAICHGGCPIRTYTARGTILAKDPYCETYKAIFSHAEELAARIAAARAGARRSRPGNQLVGSSA
jgi:sulfatase maturation enzyme AslB (radical SAM superfamily)